MAWPRNSMSSLDFAQKLSSTVCCLIISTLVFVSVNYIHRILKNLISISTTGFSNATIFPKLKP